MAGGLGFMSILTLLLAGVFFAAWKAPRWVKEIGIFALVFGFLARLIGYIQMYSVLGELGTGDTVYENLFDMVSPGVLFNGLKINMIPLIYGIIIYLVSLIVRVIQKPRI